MSWRKTLFRSFLFLAFLSALLTVPTARAQHEFEITPFGGSKFGGVIDLNGTTANTDVDYYTIKSSWDYGVLADYTVFPQFQAEFMFNHQPTSLDQHLIATDTKSYLTSADLDMYQFGFLFAIKSEEKKMQPFVVGGLGFTHFKADDDLPFSNRFAYNLGLGVKYFFSRHVGVRLEARWSPTRTTTSPQVVETFFGPQLIGVTSHAEQGQANLGLIFRSR